MRENHEPGRASPSTALITVDVEPHPRGVRVVRVRGDVDMATAPTLREAVMDQFTQAEPFVVDLEGVDFLSSAGLAVLVDAQRQSRDQRLGWAAVASRTPVVRPLELTGLHGMLPVHATLTDAIDAAIPGRNRS